VAILEILANQRTGMLFTAGAEISYLTMEGTGEICFSQECVATCPVLDEKLTMRSLGGQSYSLKPLSIATVPHVKDSPMGTIHQITNIGKGVLRIVRAVSPRFAISTTEWMYKRTSAYTDYVVDSMKTYSVRPNEGIEIHEAANGVNGSGLKAHSAAIVTMQPQAYTIAHYHPPGIEESYVILSGKPTMMMDGGKYVAMENGGQEMEPGDIVAIPPQTAHQIVNLSDEEVNFVVYSAPQWQFSTEIPITGSIEDQERWPDVTKENGWIL
jgi:mannose-6-phosphate isomerase-like protein (cupin superfamily)